MTDYAEFYDKLFNKFNVRKIEYSTIVGSPAEKLNDIMIKKFGGNIIGIKHDSIKLSDDKLYDLKLYEIFNHNYQKS